MLSKWAPWRNVLCMFRLICGVLVPKSPLSIYANQMLPVPTTLLPEMTQADLGAAHCMTLYWWRKTLLLLCNLVLGSNTICILIVVERIFCKCAVSEDFSDYIDQLMVTHICSLKNAATIVQQEASNFNVAPCCSYQKGSLTILHMRKTDAHSHVQYSGANKSL